MKILIVEDDKDISSLLVSGLRSKSHNAEVAENGNEGLFMAKSYDYDLIILDYSLPKKNGLQVCKELRTIGKTVPIIFLSVNNDTDMKIQALENGADDYMTKPFSFDELLARIKAISRRPTMDKTSQMQVDSLVIDKGKHTAVRDGKNIKLTRKEYNLLEYLMLHVGTVISRISILEHVWASDQDPMSNTVEAHMRNLRKKIRLNNRQPNLIINIPGRGYVMDTPENLKKFV